MVFELPEERRAAVNQLWAQLNWPLPQEGESLYCLRLRNDGKGMDPEKLKEIAIKRGRDGC